MEPRPAELGAVYDAVPDMTIGLEEEILLVDPETFELVPRASDVLELLDGDPRFKLELPAAQLEILTPPQRRVADAVAVLADGRRLLGERAGSLARGIGAGVHPSAGREGELSRGQRYAQIRSRYRAIAARQLVCALQVHVAVRGADRALAVYNALRSHLPEIAALAANAPYEAGRDTGLASVRPTIATMLPRQGVPPAIDSWAQFADDLAWGEASGSVPEIRQWWWELRPHVGFGTLEVRVCDTQVETADSAAIAALVHCLVAWLAARYDGGETLERVPTWRIAENRWAACRDGVEGELADLHTGVRRPTVEWLRALIETLRPLGEQLDCAAELDATTRLLDQNGALRQREVVRQLGVGALSAWLAERFPS